MCISGCTCDVIAKALSQWHARTHYQPPDEEGTAVLYHTGFVFAVCRGGIGADANSYTIHLTKGDHTVQDDRHAT